MFPKKENLFLTFDVEEFYQAELVARSAKFRIPEHSPMESDIDMIIDLCAKYNIKSTHFIVGKLAKEKPQIVKKLSDAGHEIASHSFNHRMVSQLTKTEFEEDLILSKNVLEDISGKKVVGFRAPSWSVNKANAQWFYEVLEKNNFEYSSSVYPAKTFLYGYPEAKQSLHYPEFEGKISKVLEIPQGVTSLFFKTTGFAGGFYLRALPGFLLRNRINKYLQINLALFIYMHPYEIMQDYELQNVSLGGRLIQKWHTGNTFKKLESLLKMHSEKFVRMDEYIDRLSKD